MQTTIIGIVLLVLNSIVGLILVVLTVLKMGMNDYLFIFFDVELSHPSQAGVFCGTDLNIMVLKAIRINISGNLECQVEADQSGQLKVN